MSKFGADGGDLLIALLLIKVVFALISHPQIGIEWHRGFDFLTFFGLTEFMPNNCSARSSYQLANHGRSLACLFPGAFNNG